MILFGASPGGIAAATGCLQPGAGLVGWWTGDGNANDIVGDNNGVLQGGAIATASGLVRLAFGFDGTNSYVQIPDSPVLRLTNLTVEAWVLFNSLESSGSGGSPAGQQYIVFKRNSFSASTEGFLLSKTRVSGVDTFTFTVASGFGEVAEVRSATQIMTGMWYHVVGVRGADYLQIHVNGQLESETTVNFPQDYGDFPLYFGTSGQPEWDHKLNGVLDEVSLYDRALFSSSINAIWMAGVAGKCKEPGIVAQPQSQTLGIGANASFDVVASGLESLNYQWYVNGLRIENATGSHLVITNVQSEFEGDYFVVVTNSLGSVTSAVAQLTVLVPPAVVLQPQSRINAAGTVAVFTGAATGTQPLSYVWRRDGLSLQNAGRISGATSNTLSIADVQLGDAGDYTLVVSNITGAATSQVATLTVVVADGNLETAIRSAIDKPTGLLRASDLAALTSLSVCRRGVTNLSGLESATNLINLDLAHNSIVELSPLRGLMQLSQLNLEGNRIGDLSPLFKQSNLTSLNVGDNLISDVVSLSGLTNLESLQLYRNPISTLSPLAGLKRLTSLVIYNSGLVDIQPLAGLTNLSYLELRWNPLTNAATVLAGLTNLTSLYVGGTSISNLSFVQNLTQLTFLNADHNRITDLSPLATLNQLNCLDASYNPLANPEQILTLTHLTNAYLSGNSINDVSVFTNLSELTSLTLNHNSITDPSPLAQLTRLDYLGLGWNPISDHAGLSGLTNLTSLWLDGNAISNLNFVQGMSHLKALGIRYDRLQDLAGMNGLTNLVAIFVECNQLTNVPALENLADLSHLQLVGNRLDFNAGSPTIAVIEGLQSRGVNVSYLPQNEPPVISVLAHRTIAANTTSSINFEVSDELTPEDHLEVTASSSNSGLIPNSSILLDGTGQNRTFTVTPSPNQTGTAVITLNVTDDADLIATRVALVTVMLPELLDLPDPNLEATLLLVLDKAEGTLNNTDLISLTKLHLGNPAISNLSGLELATNLTELSVVVNALNNLNVLSNLTRLESFTLQCDMVGDYSALSTLTNLKSLRLTGGSFSDLSFLENLPQLTDLALVNCRLTDAAPLIALTNLHFLDLRQNRLTNIDLLTNLLSLASLDLRLNLLDTSNNSVLTSMQNQGVFVLSQPQRRPPTITVSRDWIIATDMTSSLRFRIGADVTPSEDLLVTGSSSNTGLIPNTGITFGGTKQNRTLSLSPVANQTGTAVITITVTDDVGLSTDIAVVVTVVVPQLLVNPDPNFEGAIRLALGKTTGALNNVDLISLTELYLNDPAISNLSGLEWATNLTTLSVAAGRLENLNVLSNLTRLKTFILYAKVADGYAPLAGLTNLTALDLSGNRFGDLSFLQSLRQLTSLSLIGCRLTNVVSLAALTNLHFIDLRQNRLTDVSPLTNLVNLFFADLRLNVLETSFNSVLNTLRNQGTFVRDLPQRSPPTISLSPDWVAATDVTSSLGFQISDEVTPSDELLVTASSSNSTLVPNSSILLGGTNSDRTLTVTPAMNQTGTATIMLTVTDDAGLATSSTVLLIVLTPQLLNLPDPNLKATLQLLLGKPAGTLNNIDLISLTSLHLSNPAISNLSGLEWATNLTELSVVVKTLNNLNVLSNMTRLESFTLQCDVVADYSALSTLTNLKTLHLTGGSISDFSFLGHLIQVTDLALINCRLTDVTPIVVLTNLHFLDLRQNRLSGIRPLKDLLSLSRLDLRLNLLETSSNAFLTSLQNQGVLVFFQPQRQPPAIVTPDEWFVAANATSYQRFHAVDDAPSNETLTITASSSDANLVPGLNLILIADDPSVSGQPDDWILRLSPPLNYTGTSTITLIASNEVSMTSTATVTLTIILPLPLNAQVVGSTNLIWSGGGNAPWFGQTNVTYDGVSAAQSASIPDHQESWLLAAVTGPGDVSFWWKVSSEAPYDALEFYVGSELRYRISGEVDWNQITASVPPGSQMLTWRYFKDIGFSAGFDAAWVDQVVFKPVPMITSVAVSDSVAVITWSATAGEQYRVQYKDDLTQTDWLDLFPTVLADESTSAYTNTVTLSQRFYRVMVVP